MVSLKRSHFSTYHDHCVFFPIVQMLVGRLNSCFLTHSKKYKKVGWEVIFSELGFAGSGAHKPWWEFKGSTLEPFFNVVLRLSGAFIV